MRAGNGILKTAIVCAAAIVAAAQNSEQNGEKLVNGNDCSGCHSLDSQGAGPSWKAIAKRYAGQPAVAGKLAAKIRAGGSGTWGDVAMTPHSDVTDAQGRQMVGWILSLKDAAASAPEAPSKRSLINPGTARLFSWTSLFLQRGRAVRSPRTFSAAMSCSTLTAIAATEQMRQAVK
jgi:cytochrome c